MEKVDSSVESLSCSHTQETRGSCQDKDRKRTLRHRKDRRDEDRSPDNKAATEWPPEAVMTGPERTAETHFGPWHVADPAGGAAPSMNRLFTSHLFALTIQPVQQQDTKTSTSPLWTEIFVHCNRLPHPTTLHHSLLVQAYLMWHLSVAAVKQRTVRMSNIRLCNCMFRTSFL